jgi:hypothetical protein
MVGTAEAIPPPCEPWRSTDCPKETYLVATSHSCSQVLYLVRFQGRYDSDDFGALENRSQAKVMRMNPVESNRFPGRLRRASFRACFLFHPQRCPTKPKPWMVPGLKQVFVVDPRRHYVSCIHSIAKGAILCGRPSSRVSVLFARPSLWCDRRGASSERWIPRELDVPGL